MLNTFDALVPNTEEVEGEELEQNPSVDIAAIINRLNDLESKVNELLNKATEPTETETETEPTETETTETENESEGE